MNRCFPPEYSVGVQETPAGWRYVVLRSTDPTTWQSPFLFGICPTREQAWACARSLLSGMMTRDRAAGVR